MKDPALFQPLNSLRQTVGDPNRMIIQAVGVLMENIDYLRPCVINGLPAEVLKKFEDALPLFIGFLAGHGLARLLITSGNPHLVLLGGALKGSLAGAGYVMDIDFAASAMIRLLICARFLSRVTRDDAGKLDALSATYLDKAAVPIRDMIADLAMLAAFKDFGRMLSADRGTAAERPLIEFHSCTVEPKTGEADVAEPDLEPEPETKPDLKADPARPRELRSPTNVPRPSRRASSRFATRSTSARTPRRGTSSTSRRSTRGSPPRRILPPSER